MSEFNFELEDKEARSLLARLIKKGNDTKPLMNLLSSDLYDATMENFEKEGRPKWEKLKNATLKRRAKDKHSGKILDISGSKGLKGSITKKPPTSNEAIVGTDKKYARAHQKGYEKRNLPARPYLKVTEKDNKVFEKTTVSWIKKAF